MRGPLCQRCGDYSAGYVDGQSKALFEVSTQTTDHAVGRGCDPCLAVKERLRLRATLGSGSMPRTSDQSSQGASTGSVAWTGESAMVKHSQQLKSPATCPRCSAALLMGRDLPGCWRCGWESHDRLGTVRSSLLGSSMSDLPTWGRSSRRPKRSSSTG